MPDNVYDAVRYSNYPYAQTHPERLATVAILHGLTPPDPFHARVLEIGCGAGGNLMAMAAATPGHPRASGVDLAAEPIADGQRGDRRDRAGQRRAAPGRRARPGRRRARRVRLHRRPRRLQLDPGGRARRAAGDDRAPAWRRTASPTSPSTPTPAATSGACCATSGCWHARDVDRRRSGRARGEGAGALQVPRRAPRDQRRHLRRAARARGPGARRRADLPARARRPQPSTGTRSGSPSSPSTPARHGLAYVGEADLYGLRGEMLPDGRRARAVAARRRRPGRVRELHRPADRAPLPPEPALPRRRCRSRSSRSPERAERLHWAVRLQAEPLEVGLVADVFAELDALPPAHARLRRAAASVWAPTRGRSAEALLDGFRRERLIPHAGPLRVALRAGGAARRRPRSPAGRPRRARRSPRWPTRPCAWRSPPRGC